MVTKPTKIVLIAVTKPIKIVLIVVTKPTKIVLIKERAFACSFYFSGEQKMQWINVNEKYINYLRQFEKRIPITEYGEDEYKPFFGILFETDKFYYITQISHAQQRHQHMKQQKDFYKIYDTKITNRLLAVVNLNYMFPIPKNETSEFKKSEIDKHRTFKTDTERSKYINLLNTEIKVINSMDISNAAEEIYTNKYKYPQSKLAQRCLDYRQLEKYGHKWIIHSRCRIQDS